MFLAVILVVLGFILFVRGVSRSVQKRNAEHKKAFSDGEILRNKYIIDHEKKIVDDKEYEEYLEWCNVKGEIPVEKKGFDEHRMEEYHLYKKLLKHGISGL